MFESILKFLKDPANIPSIGVGIATIIAAAWAVFTYFDKKSEDKKSQKAPSAPSVTNIAADHGSFAAGHIAGSVTINPDAKEVAQQVAAAQNDRYDKILAEIAREKGVEVAPLRAILVKLGEKGVSEEDIPKRLDTAADELLKLRAENEILRRGPPALAAIAEEVQALLDKGEFDNARRALARGREPARALRIDSSCYEAAFLAQEARVDDLQLAYRPAAAKYAEAASLVAPFDTEQQWRFLLAQAGELYKQGDEFGDNAALAQAINVNRCYLDFVSRAEKPLEWANAKNNLASALAKLGEREHGTALLEDAVTIYREALEENTRERDPAGWAETQTGLAAALVSLGGADARLGERERGTERFKAAVIALREALKELPREHVSLKWAAAQINLGAALRGLGTLTHDNETLKESIFAYREALKVYTRERVPLDWAMTLNNLGNTLRMLCEFEEAVSAYRAALQEYTHARAPLNWAVTNLNLAMAYGELGHLDDALKIIAGTLEIFRAAGAESYLAQANNLRDIILTTKGRL